MLTEISNYVIPVVMFLIIVIGMKKKVKVYETFLDGALEGIKVVYRIVPTLIGLVVGVGVLRASGFFDLCALALQPVAAVLKLPVEILSLLAVKIFSSSAATGLALDIFRTYGPDSYQGLITSILMGCTETVFYTMSVYFLAAKVTKTGYTLKGALLATLVGTIASVLLAMQIY